MELIFSLLGALLAFLISYYFHVQSKKEFQKYYGIRISSILDFPKKWKFEKHVNENNQQKDIIGRYISDKIDIDNATILLDAGTTTERVAKYLAEKQNENLTVITANPIAALHFASRDRDGCYLFSGEIDTDYAGIIGTITQMESLIDFAKKNAKISTESQKYAVIGSLPMLYELGPCSIDKRTLHIKRTLIDHADKVFIAVDIGKFYEKKDYKDKYFPVFESEKEWKNFLKSNDKNVTIVTCLTKSHNEDEIIKKNKLFFGANIEHRSLSEYDGDK